MQHVVGLSAVVPISTQTLLSLFKGIGHHSDRRTDRTFIGARSTYEV